MKASTLWVGAIFASLCLGVCPDQPSLDLATCPFAVDPNMIAVNPVTGERLPLDYIITDVGREWSYDGYGCDDDGNLMVFSASKGVLSHPTPETFTLRGTQTAVGVDYIHISVTDVPMEHQTAYTVTGTLVVLAVQPNRPPVLCGGRP